MLFGRSREEGIVGGLIGDAQSGRSAVLAVVGDVGIGKSALLAHATARAEGLGMNVLSARGVEAETRIPFAGLFELLRPTLSYVDALAGPQREALEGALALRPAREQDRFAVGAATLSLLAAYAEVAPLMVVVDDAHWVDRASGDALLFALRRLVADPIAGLISARSDQPSWLDGSDLAMLELGGLNRAAAADLVRHHRVAGVSLSDDAIERVYRGTGGNPLAIIEHVDDDRFDTQSPIEAPLHVGARIGRVYLDRCADLPDSCRNMLALAAASDTGDLAVLARAATALGLTVYDLAPVEELGLVVITESRVEFRHPLVRSAIYGDMSADRRREIHRVLASAVPDADPDRRAWHLALASLGPDVTASSQLEQAGRRARKRSAYDAASQAFERAGDLAGDGDRHCALLYDAADSAWLGGQAERAVELLEAARQGAPPAELALLVDHLRGHIAMHRGFADEGRKILLDGAARAANVDPDRAAIMVAEAVNAAFYSGNATAMAEAAALLPSERSSLSSRSQFFALMAGGMALIFAGDHNHRGASLVGQAVALVDATEELAEDPRLLAWTAMGPLWLRESMSAGTITARALAAVHRDVAVGVLPFLLSLVAVDRVAGDRWAEAEAGLHEAIRWARETGQRTDLAFACARLAWLEARLGKDSECREHAEAGRSLGRELNLGLCRIWCCAALGDLALGSGDLDEALRHFDQELTLLADLGVADVDLSPEPELVEVNLRLGRSEVAAAHLNSYLPKAEAKGRPWALARAARCRGLVGPDTEVDQYFGDALDLHERTPDVYETGRTRLAYGGRLRRARKRVRAREQLRRGVDIFDHLGAAPWSEAARRELAATGETALRRDAPARDQLTPQELQVALLLAAGRTTKQAAAALFLSPKTVEYHLASVYRRLGVNSRPTLAAVMSDRRQPDGPSGGGSAGEYRPDDGIAQR